MTCQFQTRLTEQQYLLANRLNYRETLQSYKLLKLVAWLTTLYCVVFFGIDYLKGRSLTGTHLLHGSALAVAGAIGGILFCVVVSYLSLPMRTRKLFQQQKLLHSALDYEVGEEAVTCVGPHTTTDMPYGLVYKWVENVDIFLIYHSDQTFQILPKADAPAQAIDLLREKLTAHNIPGRSL